MSLSSSPLLTPGMAFGVHQVGKSTIYTWKVADFRSWGSVHWDVDMAQRWLKDGQPKWDGWTDDQDLWRKTPNLTGTTHWLTAKETAKTQGWLAQESQDLSEYIRRSKLLRMWVSDTLLKSCCAKLRLQDKVWLPNLWKTVGMLPGILYASLKFKTERRNGMESWSSWNQLVSSNWSLVVGYMWSPEKNEPMKSHDTWTFS